MIEFSKKNINIKTLGERLRDIRQNAGVSIEEISKVTKISKQYLEHIENDNYDNLPSNVYVKGFLRSYSNFLGIDAEDVLRIYKKERGIQNNIKKLKSHDVVKKKYRKPAIVVSLKGVAGVFMGLLFGIIIWYFYIETGKFSETPRLLLISPSNNTVISESSVEIAGNTDIGNNVTVNGQAIFVNEKGEFKERVNLKEGINKLIIKSVNKFGREVVKEINLAAQYTKDLLNDKNEEKDVNNIERFDDKVRLFVKIVDNPVWISVKIDGIKNYNGTMLADTEQVFEGMNEIVITSGMASKTLIKVNQEKEYHKLAEITGVVRDVLFRKNKNIKKDVKITTKSKSVSETNSNLEE